MWAWPGSNTDKLILILTWNIGRIKTNRKKLWWLHSFVFVSLCSSRFLSFINWQQCHSRIFARLLLLGGLCGWEPVFQLQLFCLPAPWNWAPVCGAAMCGGAHQSERIHWSTQYVQCCQDNCPVKLINSHVKTWTSRIISVAKDSCSVHMGLLKPMEQRHHSWQLWRSETL